MFVQWNWQEKTSTFLLILHFDADGSKPNLRKQDMAFISPENKDLLRLYFPLELSKKHLRDSIRHRTVVTWAPSHVESGLVSELLCYANIINGLHINERNKLKERFETIARALKEKHENPLEDDSKIFEDYALLKDLLEKRIFLWGLDYNYKHRKTEIMLCFELCPQYIDYLKEVLKEYL